MHTTLYQCCSSTGPQSLDSPIEFVLQKMFIPKLSQGSQKKTFCVEMGSQGVFFLLSFHVPK